MIKKKLRSVRIQKGFTQEQIAELLCKDTSNYCRKEKGEVKINTQEWGKIAKYMQVSLEEIYEADPTEDKEQDKLNYSVPMTLVEHFQDYVRLLKEENAILKEKLKLYQNNSN